MRRAPILLLLLFLGAPAHAQLRRGAASGDELLGADARLLVITAHPDDESLFAPLLGQTCAERGAQCSLLVLTRGENGPCLLPEGCGPDLAALRSAELRAAANMLHVSLTQWAWPDVLVTHRGEWPASIADDIAAEVRRFRPTAVLTFDPTHGSSCHPAHRAAAELTLLALYRVDDPPPLFYLETFHRELVLDDATPNAGGLRTYSGGWEYLLADVALHRSQFTADQRATLAATPPERQHVWLLDARRSALAPYVFGCL